MRTMDDVLREELSAYRRRHEKTALRILEVGCARSVEDDYLVGDGWSSVTLAQDALENKGSVTGIDLDVSAVRSLLKQKGLTEELYEGDSRGVMRQLLKRRRTFDVIFLDSGNDPDLVMEEFLLAERLLKRPGLLLADDMDEADPEVVKGLKLMPYLREHSYEFRMTHRETPWTNRDILVLDFV